MKIYKYFLALLFFFCLTIPTYSLDLVRDKLSLNGYFDATPGFNRYESEKSGMDAYHWVLIFSWNITDNIEVIGDLTMEHGPSHTSSNRGDIKTRSYAILKYNDALKLNIGKFLTPFGEQNLYHDATPSYISVTSPQSIYGKRKVGSESSINTNKKKFVSDRLFSKEGAGLWFWGDIDISNKWIFDYNLYVINGHAGVKNNEQINEYQIDDNENKGVGGKIVFNSPYNFNFGGSYYNEKDGRLENDSLRMIYSFQLIINPGNFGLRSEYLKSDIQAHANLSHANPEAFYIQTDYIFADKYTPYIRYDSYKNKTYNEEEYVNTIGLNYMINPQVYLKGEYGFIKEKDDITQFQISIAF